MMRLKKVRIGFICLTGFILGMPTAVLAGADSGVYIGAGAGNATVKDSDFKETDSAYKIFGGYNFGVIPRIFIFGCSHPILGCPKQKLSYSICFRSCTFSV